MKRFSILFAILLTLICIPYITSAQENDEGQVEVAEIPAADESDAVAISDSNLAAAIRSVLGLDTDAEITSSDMLNLKSLRAKEAGITDLSGLEHATHLTTLNLSKNEISNLTPLKNLLDLNHLNLYSNALTDLGSLSGLENLTFLDVGKNVITDIAGLEDVTSLTSLYLDDNKLTDFSDLSSLTGLSVLSLSRTGISDLSVLENLTDLTQLYLTGNEISSITALSKLPKLGWLFLAQNQISDVSPLVDMKDLISLRLLGNPVSDASLLYPLTQGSLIDVDIEIPPPSDTDPPSVVITVPATAQNGAFDVTITFSEAVSGFEQSELSISGSATATVTAWATTDDTVFTATITPTRDGEMMLSVAAGVATDAANNNNTTSETQMLTVDMTSPDVSISVPADAQNSAFDVTITFTQVVSNFLQADLTLSGTAAATVTAWSSTDDRVYTATVTPTTEGDVVLSVMADVATDAASNNNTAAETQTVTVDMTSPGVSLSVPADAQNGAFDVTITFSESVSDFVQGDVSLSGTASITGWTTTDDTVFTATLTPTTSGTVVVSIPADVATDAASNDNTAATPKTVSIDMTPPDVSISVPTDAQSGAFEATITFTEVVSGFEQADLTLSGTATASITAWSSTDDTTYTATLTPTTSGTVILGIADGVATDAASNNNTAATPKTVSIDMTPPDVSISVPTDAQSGAFEATITFTEVVSGFEQADLTLSGTATASITAWSSTDDTTYTATLTPTTSGTVILGIADGVATDAASNNNTAATPQTVSIDMTPPGVSISVPTDAQSGEFEATITFTEVVSGFEQADLTLSGTATASITAWATTDDTIFTTTITPTASGTVVLSIAAGAVTDTAGNTNVLSTAQVSITLDVADDSVFVSVCDRTPQVSNAIVAALPHVSDCADVTAADLATIKGLDLENENITALKEGDFNGLTALEWLILSRNDLSSLPARVFDNLTALTLLYLGSNDLSSLPAGIFDNLTALTKLYLGSNDLGSLPARVFDNLTALTMLDLKDNDLGSLPAGVFDNLTALTKLDLRDNDLSSLPAGVFDNLTALVELYLGSNDLGSLPARVFDNLTALGLLGLWGNDLSSLPAGVFDNLTALTKLRLYHNDLISLPADIFDNLTALKGLRLDFNDLISLPASIFDNLTALVELDLSYNDLSSLPSGVFDKNTALGELNLSYNDLSSLPAGIFEGLTALVELHLNLSPFGLLPVKVSLKRIEEGQFKATARTGAPFDIVLPLTVTNGSIDDGGTPRITISTGTVESESVTVSRTPGTVDAVWVDIGTLPGLPNSKDDTKHSGYALVKSSDLPLTVIEGPGPAAPGIAAEVVLPNETTLSANYPNPFNPETWIPYQLSNTSDVKITIYDMRGTVVRRLDLGHQRAGYYTSRSRAAYWDGRNNRGERVASGIYFYQLQADHISLLRKMVILQ